MRLPTRISSRLRLPVVAAPMLRVSGPELVAAACRNGVIGAFPTGNAGTSENLDAWLTRIGTELQSCETPAAPWCANLVVRRGPEYLKSHIDVLVRHRVEMVITSVGSPAPVIKPLKSEGCLVFADVATLRHAKQAIDVGVDGLVLLSAGAGGQTGWLNGFAFVRAVRDIFDGPIMLAGGISDGAALLAAMVLDCDLGYMGTRFIASHESMASQAYKEMVVGCDADDVMLTRAISGMPASMLRPSLLAAGLDLEALDESISPSRAKELFGVGEDDSKPTRWKDLWSAGHTVSGVRSVSSVAEIVEQTEREFRTALRRTAYGKTGTGAHKDCSA